MNNTDTGSDKTQNNLLGNLSLFISLCYHCLPKSIIKTSQFLYYNSEDLPNGSSCVVLWAKTPSVA